MRTDIMKEITDYLRFLSNTYNLEVSFHPIEGHYDFVLQSHISESCTHKSLLCRQIINVGSDMHNRCIQHHIKCFNLCKKNEVSISTCFAGVSFLIFPVYKEKKLAGYLSVGSYYQDKNSALKSLKLFCKEEKLDYDLLSKVYDNSVSEFNYSIDFIKTIINPVCSMLEIAYIQGQAMTIHKDDDTFYIRILSYIKNHYTQNISSEKIAKQHNCSVSYLSHFFKKHCGISLPEYINFLRINDAKTLLEITDMNIQEISYSVGYSSSNYFSNVFKKSTGLSPKAYRAFHLSKQ